MWLLVIFSIILAIATPAVAGTCLIHYALNSDRDPHDNTLYCKRCHYNLSGSSSCGICPECGVKGSPETVVKGRRIPHRGLLIAGILLYMLSIASMVGPCLHSATRTGGPLTRPMPPATQPASTAPASYPPDR